MNHEFVELVLHFNYNCVVMRSNLFEHGTFSHTPTLCTEKESYEWI